MIRTDLYLLLITLRPRHGGPECGDALLAIDQNLLVRGDLAALELGAH